MLKKFILLALSGLFDRTVGAQTTSWPSPGKPITFINPCPPGGAVDAFGRPLAKQLSTQLGTSILVDNRGGDGGTLGKAAEVKIAPRLIYLASWCSAPLYCPEHVSQPAL